MKEYSKAVFKTGFYLCIFLDETYRTTSILEIGNNLKRLSESNDFLEKMIEFFEEAIIYRIMGQFKTEFKKLRHEFITNQLTTLPESIGDLPILRDLYLANNQLTTLPETLNNLSSLNNLRIPNNHLDSSAKNMLKKLKKKLKKKGVNCWLRMDGYDK